MARAFARPVLHFRTVPDRVIHMPSWENGWAQVRKKHGERSKISCQIATKPVIYRLGRLSPDRHSVAGGMANR